MLVGCLEEKDESEILEMQFLEFQVCAGKGDVVLGFRVFGGGQGNGGGALLWAGR